MLCSSLSLFRIAIFLCFLSIATIFPVSRLLRLLVLCQFDIKLNLNWENWQAYGVIFLINDWCGRGQPAVGGAIPEQVLLDAVRK